MLTGTCTYRARSVVLHCLQSAGKHGSLEQAGCRAVHISACCFQTQVCLSDMASCCRLCPEVEVAKLSLRVQHTLLCCFGRECAMAAIEHTALCLQQLEAAALDSPSKQDESQATNAPALDSTEELECLAAAGLLGQAASSNPQLQPVIWDALWPVLQGRPNCLL